MLGLAKMRFCRNIDFLEYIALKLKKNTIIYDKSITEILITIKN